MRALPRCRRCDSDRVLDVSGKTGDLSSYMYQGREGEGYVPGVAGIGEGDYVNLRACLECGQLQGDWPQETPESLTLETADDAEEGY